MIKKTLTVLKLARLYWRAFVYDIQWQFSHPKFYAKRMAKRFNQEEHTYWAKVPLDPAKYPFDKQKAESALYEIDEWIREDERKKK